MGSFGKTRYNREEYHSNSYPWAVVKTYQEQIKANPKTFLPS